MYNDKFMCVYYSQEYNIIIKWRESVLLPIERLHVTSHVQVVVYSLGLTVLIYGTLAYLHMRLFSKTKLIDAE